MHDTVPHETLFHCKRLGAAGVLTHERALFLVEGENVALQVEGGCIGSSTAFPRTAVHGPLGRVSLHVLLEVIFALEILLTYCAGYLLFVGFPHVSQKLCPRFPHKGTSLLTQVALVNLPMPLQPAEGGKGLPTSLMGTPEEWLAAVLALVASQLLVLLKGLPATFNIAHILFLWIFMFAFNVFLQIRFCVEFLITVIIFTNKWLFSGVNQDMSTQMVVSDEGLATALIVTNKWPLPRVLAQMRI